jgi:hypothetical protein
MSSPVQSSAQDPVQGDADSEPVLTDAQHEATTRRLQNDVVEAALCLEREAAKHNSQNAFQLNPDNTLSFRIPVVRRAVERVNQEETNERVWSALTSEFLAPPRQGFGVSGIAMVIGSIGAVVVAAAVALLVVNLLNIPSPATVASGEDEAAKNQSFSSTVATLSRITAAQAKMQPADDEAPAPAPLTGVALAAAGPANDDIAVAKSPAPLAPPSSEIKPAAVEPLPPPEIRPTAVEPSPTLETKPVAIAPSPTSEIKPAAVDPSLSLEIKPTTIAPAPAPPPPAPAAVPEPQPTVTLTQDEITSLLKRGRDLIAAGDIASARLVLTHLADAGVAEASFALAGTFDPTVLENLRIVGMRPDPAKARVWYSRAAEQGSLEARQRLQALR